MSLQLLPEVLGADRTADLVRERPKLLQLSSLVLPVRLLRIISSHAVQVTPVNSCFAAFGFLLFLILLITLLRHLLLVLRPVNLIDITVVSRVLFVDSRLCVLNVRREVLLVERVEARCLMLEHLVE